MTQKEWYLAKELVGLEGMPKSISSVSRKASLEKWEKRKIDGVKGVTYEYNIKSFPEKTRNALKATTEIGAENKGERVKIPYYDIQASAGQGALINYEDAPSIMELNPEYLINQGISPKNLCAITVKGDSMEPTLFDGDVVIVKREPELSRVLEGVYVIRIDHQLFIKRIQYNKFEGYIQVNSDNVYYRSFTIEGDDLNAVQIIGEAVLTLGRVRKITFPQPSQQDREL